MASPLRLWRPPARAVLGIDPGCAPVTARTAPRTFRTAGATEALRIAALGTNLWALAVLLPLLEGVRDPRETLLAPSPLAVLAVGVLALLAGPRIGPRTIATAALLFVFPVSLAALSAWHGGADPHAGQLFVTALSVAAYGAVATDACARPLALRTSTAEALPAALAAVQDPRQVLLRRALLGGSALAALLVSVVAPALGSEDELVRLWRDAAEEATVLGAVVGAVASAAAIAGLVGPALRAARPGELPRRPASRIAIALFLAGAGLAGALILRHLEAR